MQPQMPGKEKAFLTATSVDLRVKFGFGKNGWWFSWSLLGDDVPKYGVLGSQLKGGNPLGLLGGLM